MRWSIRSNWLLLVTLRGSFKTSRDATYEGWCGSKEARVDWSKDVAVVHNLIRGCDPQPGAWSTLDDQKVAFFGSAVASSDASAAESGTITDIDDSGMVIACGAGQVKVRRGRIERGAKSAAGDLGVSAGDRFR